MTVTTKKRKPPITKWFGSWLSTRDTSSVFKKQQDKLRDQLLEAVEEFGVLDEDSGHVWYDLPQPVKFEEEATGKVRVYSRLKRERRLSPKVPTPDPELAEELLKKKGLWLSAKDQKLIADLRVRCPYAFISIDVDVDAVALAEFDGTITEQEYQDILVEQTETFAFIPVE